MSSNVVTLHPIIFTETLSYTDNKLVARAEALATHAHLQQIRQGTKSCFFTIILVKSKTYMKVN